MRELLFRGVRKDGAGWIDGFIVNVVKDSHILLPIGVSFEVHPETVGQFIGKQIKDRKIFDGDIVFDEIEMDEGDKRTYFVVTWIEELSRFALLNTDAEYWDYLTTAFTSFEHFMECHFNMDEMTVEGIEKMHYAGNIHDNPELLK